MISMLPTRRRIPPPSHWTGARRALGWMAVAALAATGCKTWQEESGPPDEFLRRTALDPEENRIVGVTLHDGGRLDFDTEPRPATVRGDTIHASVAGEPFQVPLGDTERVWVQWHRVSPGRTVLAAVGVAAATFGVVAAIAVATKESCPFVYSWDGERWVFDAEPYGGATTRGLERADYSELENLAAVDGEYRLRITNEVNETQYTNFLELWAVHHPEGTRVVADEHGTLHTVRDPVTLSAAVDGSGRDLRPWLQATDGRIWEHPPVPTPTGELRQDLVLTFPRPEGAAEGRLLARVATGSWGSHMIREFYEMRGNALEAFYQQIDESPDARDGLFAWNVREELYTLQVLVEEPSGWEVRGLLPGGGPFIAEDRAVPLDLRHVSGDEVRIRLRPPVGFWGLDSFMMDYGPTEPVQVARIAPRTAVTSEGENVLPSLTSADDAYYAMPVPGDWAELRFPAVDAPAGMEQTFFLNTRGFYRLHLTADQEPDLARLDEIRNVPGAPVRIAVEAYEAARQAGGLGDIATGGGG